MKRITCFIVIIAIAVIAVWNYQQNQKSTELSDLALENIEALANDEYPQMRNCYMTIIYGSKYFVRDCDGCGYSSGDYFMGSHICFATW